MNDAAARPTCRRASRWRASTSATNPPSRNGCVASWPGSALWPPPPILSCWVLLAWGKPIHQTTPLDLTFLPTDVVTVIDPAHPLYGQTLPLIGVTNKQYIGRACAVWIQPGIERPLPCWPASSGDFTAPPGPGRVS